MSRLGGCGVTIISGDGRLGRRRVWSPLRGQRALHAPLVVEGRTPTRPMAAPSRMRQGMLVRAAIPVFDLLIQIAVFLLLTLVLPVAVEHPVAPSVLLAVWPTCLGLGWLVLAAWRGLYLPGGSRGYLTQWLARARVSGWSFLAIAAASTLGAEVPTGWFAAVLAVSSALVGGALGAAIHHVIAGRPGGRERAVLIGTATSIARAAQRLDIGRRDVDVVGTVELPAATSSSELLAEESRILAAVAAASAEIAIVTTDSAEAGIPAIHLVWALEKRGAQVLVDTGFDSLRANRLSLRWTGGLVTVAARPRATHTLGTVASASLQWAIAALGLLVSLPIMVAIAIAVKVESDGPVFFIQRRVGLYGRQFPMFKFRTMHPDADALVHRVAQDEGAPDRGPMFKAKADPRVTKVGRVLRRTSLDELPQLMNVVLGHMLLVGPRPALDREVTNYRGYEDRRLHARPGLTGLWQVSGRSDLDWQRSVELDQTYVDGRTLTMDAAILIRTPRAVLSGRGAY